MPEMHITVGTSPVAQLSLQQELRLVKAALLYADKVTLYSIQASAISAINNVSSLSLEHKLSVIKVLAPYLSPESSSEISAFLSMRRQKRFRNTRQIIMEKRFEAVVQKSWIEIEKLGEQIALNAELPQLQYASRQGCLEIHEFNGMGTQQAIADFISGSVILAVRRNRSDVSGAGWIERDADPIIMEFTEQICDAVCNGQTFPIFDKSTGDLVKFSIRENKIAVSEVMQSKAKHMPIASALFEKLPVFENATVEEVIDVRRELEKPLVRFRSAIVGYSAIIESAPWETDFASEAELLFHSSVAPAILEIEESINSEASIVALLLGAARKLADKPSLTSGAVLSLALATVGQLPTEVSVAMGYAGPAYAAVRDAYTEWKEKKNAAERNALYFYYRAGKIL